jgi:serine/threonine protein kinase/tricorn protease-like protein
VALAAGIRLGRYEIRSQLGAGGMGEVYLAHDTQLGRTVALKIMSSDVARDQQRMHRFLQEARAASALSHPNIAHIYEIGEANGMSFIAMEHVEGESLETKISGRPLESIEVLQISSQIADALDEAHRKGITHRDIKSANIMITPRGQVKVLDFGLAKVSSPAQSSEQQPTPDSEIATRVKTNPGVVMGTVNYMSPEQALGREVDHRSDIFSLGVVIYEMATGRLPFTGASVTETIDKIAHVQPEAMMRFNYNVPAELEVIVKKALRKERGERYQTAKDMLVDLRSLRQELEFEIQRERSVPPASRSGSIMVSREGMEGEPTRQFSPQTAETPQAHPTTSAEYLVREIKRHKTGVLLILAGLVVAVVGIVVLFKFLGGKPAEPARQMKFARLTNSQKGGSAAISPDGKYVVHAVYEGELRSLWVRQVSSSSEVQIVPPSQVNYRGSTFSPDGNLIYYTVEGKDNPRGTLYQIPVLGGTPRKVLTRIDGPVTFSPDGKQIAFMRHDSGEGLDLLMIANVDGSQERVLAKRTGESSWFAMDGPAWSPDGKVIALAGGYVSGEQYMTVVEVPVAGGPERIITSQKWTDVYRVVWMSDGKGLVTTAASDVTSGTQIWYLSYPEGQARRVTNDLNGYGTFSLGVTADNSTIVTVQEDFFVKLWVTTLGEDAGRSRQITNGQYDGFNGIAWTPDGQIVYGTKVGENSDIWRINADGTNNKRLMDDAVADVNPVVSPDGRYIVFMSFRSGVYNIWRMDMDGGNLRPLTEGGTDSSPVFSPDGQWVVFDSWRSGKKTLWKVSIDGGTPVQLTEKASSRAVISPDGKLIACEYFDEQVNPPRWRPAIIPFAGGPPIKIFDIPRNTSTRKSWTPDGRSLLYEAELEGASNIWSMPVDGDEPRQLTNWKTDDIFNFALSPDGKQIAAARGVATDDVVLIKDFR